jgi:hypothetical protein
MISWAPSRVESASAACWLAAIGCPTLFPHVRALLLLIDDLETTDEPYPGLLVGGQIDNTGAIQLAWCVT